MSYFAECLCFELGSPEEVKGDRPETVHNSCLSMNMHCSGRHNLKRLPCWILTSIIERRTLSRICGKKHNIWTLQIIAGNVICKLYIIVTISYVAKVSLQKSSPNNSRNKIWFLHKLARTEKQVFVLILRFK